MSAPTLRQSDADIADRAFAHLSSVVRVDSQSDERSTTIPSTDGQRVLADQVAAFFAGLGATTERDAHASVIAAFVGRVLNPPPPPLALMVHLDTARGTEAVDELTRVPAWDGSPIAYPANPALSVGTATYPAVAPFVGDEVVHGPGDAPFGLDDKLGLTHMMTLAWLLAENPDLPHPPLYLIGRPDEEIGRMEAVVGLAALLAERGVRSGYTVDGILPFEVNVENFNAAAAAVAIPARRLDTVGDERVAVFVGGVNTHGCTARAEGYRAAARLLAEVVDTLAGAGKADLAVPVWIAPDTLRDCDARAVFAVGGPAGREALMAALATVIGPHIPRGASFRALDGAAAAAALKEASGPATTAAADALTFVGRLLSGDTPDGAVDFVVAAEASEGREGYTNPYRAFAGPDGAKIDVRIRDFDADGLAARKAHVRAVTATVPGAVVAIHDQYVNMGPRLADRRELVTWAQEAGAAVGAEVRELPIRGGTGVDPFLDRGVAIANVGTGYFAPESEKELTSTGMMARHAKWLVALVARAAQER